MLTRRICYLVEERGVESEQIAALTFTRAAAHELRQRVMDELGSEAMPRIATLHSFALRQLLRNSSLIGALPQPLRIADDWEERKIVLEDLKAMLHLGGIDDARDLLNRLSADWQSLTADALDWERRFPIPRFLGAWQEHRRTYGYTLRAELVYQLKRALEQHERFRLEGPPSHLLVDEYQDLNRCDLAVIKAIQTRGAEVYVAGDDDQSIYGFRLAHPEGIRRFPRDYDGATSLGLEVCMRCDPNILELGLFVARQDHRRIDKAIRPEKGRAGGEVAVLRFLNGKQEAEGIAQLCRYLAARRGLQPEQVLILVRSDRYQVFSAPIRAAIERVGVPVVAGLETNPLDEPEGRQTLAFLRLMENPNDHLAWRTLFQLRRNIMGEKAITSLYDFARSQGIGFGNAVESVAKSPSAITAPHGQRVKDEVHAIRSILSVCASKCEGQEGTEAVMALVSAVLRSTIENPEEREKIRGHFAALVSETDAGSLGQLLGAIETSSEYIEQQVEKGKINIMTMHKAKGLTAEATIIAVAEDEYLPGRAQGDAMGDERRLLYVSLTRAKHFLYVTYCEQRTGRQQHTGRTAGEARRSLTTFLRDAPIAPQPGPAYVERLAFGRR